MPMALRSPVGSLAAALALAVSCLAPPLQRSAAAQQVPALPEDYVSMVLSLIHISEPTRPY